MSRHPVPPPIRAQGVGGTLTSRSKKDVITGDEGAQRAFRTVRSARRMSGSRPQRGDGRQRKGAMPGGEVQLVDLVKRFDEVTAVDGVNLRIPGGEFFSLLGPSGCGKT